MKFIDTILFKTLKLPAADVCVEGQPKEKKKIKTIEYNIFRKLPHSARKHINYFETPQLEIFRSQIQEANFKFVFG